ncbi:hypothetical protein OQA88_5098 [Cercophora sp. LCS_1]
MFHELGHAVHYLVSRAKYFLPFSKDFFEILSLLLENWVWEPGVLKKLGRHHQNGTKLPDDLIVDIARTKNVNQAHAMLGQLHVALFDLTIHAPGSHEAAEAMDLTQLWNQLKRDVVGLPLGDDEGFHIFRKYDAGYFAYPLSKVYATDICSTFFAADPMSTEVGLRYRRMVLEPGASRPEADILAAYLGRECIGDVYYAEQEEED